MEAQKQLFTGEEFDPAAGDHVDDSNSYISESQDVPVWAPTEDEVEETPKVESNPQADNFRALREEVDRMKADREKERSDYQLQIDLLRANSTQRQVQEPVKERKFLEGMDESDVPSVADLRKEWERREEGYIARLEELQVAQSHPDYQEVIEKYAIPLIQQKPHLAEGIQGSKNKALFAYELGKMAQQLHSSPAPKVASENAQRIVENSKKPGTLSQSGGQGILSKADHYATMSDREFMKMANKYLEEI